MKAVLFVGHGSKDPEGNEEVRLFVASVAKELDVPIVETCFLEFEQPDVYQGLEACVQKGATQVVVIPIMLIAAGHAKIHIPSALDDMRKKYPNIRFTYGRPVGVSEQLVELLTNRMAETGLTAVDDCSDLAVLIVGRGSSDPDANGDIYKMSRLFWEKWKGPWVETAFMGVTFPLIQQGIEKCLKLGARHVVVLPYFLFTGVLMKRMNDLLQEHRRRYPDRTFTLAGYFGDHPLLRQVMIDRVQEAFHGEIRMNCDTCQFRLEATEHLDHHHHHHHDHHGHDVHHLHHDHEQGHDHQHHRHHTHR